MAGRHQRGGQSYETEQQSGNILTGFDTRFLAEALGVNQELARRLQSQTDDRGEIVHVPQGLQLLRPSRIQEEQQQQQEEEFSGERYHAEWRGNYSSNGLDENFCTMRIRENINDPSRADIYNPRSGRITVLNNQKLPILNNVQMSANRVVLRRVTLKTFFSFFLCIKQLATILVQTNIHTHCICRMSFLPRIGTSTLIAWFM